MNNIKFRIFTDKGGDIHFIHFDMSDMGRIQDCCIELKIPQMDEEDIYDFLTRNLDIYYDAKKWGFGDTEIGDRVYTKLKKEKVA